MNSRTRLFASLNHQEPDRIPLDLGASPVTGMHVSSVYKLRQALQLDPPGTPVKVVEPYQMLGEIAPDLVELLGVDVLGVSGPRTMFGFANQGWKAWTTFDDTPVLAPAAFNIQPEEDGSILIYPEGDPSVPPSGRMPKGGFYFDSIPRQEALDEEKLDPADNLEEFSDLSEADLAYFVAEIERLHTTTDKAILANFGGMAFGDIALVPVPWLKHPKGIRGVAEWYMSTVTHPEYVWAVFEVQCEIALRNLERLYAAIGNKIAVVYISGADFGTQNGPFISPKTYRDLYLPFHKALNDWVHQHTAWKTFIHSCGSVAKLIPDFIAAGFDILNPVQTSAAGMDPSWLKSEFGEQVTFWGGGVDTQHTLPFGSPAEIRQQVRERMAIFGLGGGFVFNTIHNVQAGVPVENLLALYQAVGEF